MAPTACLGDNSALTDKCHQSLLLTLSRLPSPLCFTYLVLENLESLCFSQAEAKTPIYCQGKKNLYGICQAEMRCWKELPNHGLLKSPGFSKQYVA